MSFENKFNNNGSQHRRPPFEDKLNINYDHHHRSPNGQPNTSIEILTPSIKAISDSFKEMHTQFESLKRVNDSLVNFNKAFGSFLFGMAANDTTLQWKQYVTEETIERHKEYVKRMNSLEATKAVHTPSPKSSIATTSKSYSYKADNTHANNQSSSNNSNKKRKIAKEEKEPLVSQRKFVAKVNIRKIIDRLPLEYREKTEPMRQMENILKILKLHPTGLSIKDITAETRMQQYLVTKCLNALTASKEVLKLNQEGRYSTYQLDPAKYPSENR